MKASTTNFTLTEDDKEKIENLRKWSSEVELSQNVANSDTSVPAVSVGGETLSECQQGHFFDLTCQVVSTCIFTQGTCIILRVWDGTKIRFPTYAEDTDKENLELHCDQHILRRAGRYTVDVFVFDNHVSSVENLKPGDYIKFVNIHAAEYKDPHTGTQHCAVPTLQLIIHGGGAQHGRCITKLNPDSLEVGHVKLLMDEVQDDNISEIDSFLDCSNSELCLQTTIRQNQTTTIEKHEQEAVQNESNAATVDVVASTSGSVGSSRTCSDNRCMLRTVTVITAHHEMKMTPLADVQMHPPPYKFRVKVQFLDYQPKAVLVENFLRLYCPICHFVSPLPHKETLTASNSSVNQSSNWSDTAKPFCCEDGINIYKCPNCRRPGNTSLLHCVFMLKLLLRDSTGWIVAQLWKEEAEKFLNGKIPVDVLKHPLKFNQIQADMDRICGGKIMNDDNLSQKERPWAECCIMSYSTEAGQCYQIFDTCLCPEEN